MSKMKEKTKVKMAMDFQVKWRQAVALTRKNLVIAVVRKWKSTLFRSLVFPIALLVLLLEIQNFTTDNNRYGFGEPHSPRSLAASMEGVTKPLVLVQEPGLGPDFLPVLEKITSPLDQSKIVHLDEEAAIETTCPVDFHGVSPCHAVVIFRDSPLSGGINATWNYTIRTDPSLDTFYQFDVFSQDSATDRVLLPLQTAVENAMANLTTNPDFQAFTAYTQEEQDVRTRQGFQALALYILSFVFYITMIPCAQHLASMMALERESGLSQLLDAMGGGAAYPRVVSYVVSFDLLYLPLWIVLGSLFWGLLLPGQNAAVLIFWQIFTGWATASASTFGTAFFKRSAFASQFVPLIPFLLAVIAAFTENVIAAQSPAQVLVLSFFFPSMNYVYFFSFVTKSEIAGVRLDFSKPLIPNHGDGRSLIVSVREDDWVTKMSPSALWGFLIIQIVVYPLLASLVETVTHGNNRRRRSFDTTDQAANSNVAIETTDLQKYYRSAWKRWCCCGRAPKVKAIDGLDLVSQRRQILCLLGPNGSGKTTTLDMIAGFQAPSGGSIKINASQSQIGICPQRNVMWDNLTVREHILLWNSIKGNVDNPITLEQLIQKCDLTAKKNSFARDLSGGMKRKLQLACMLVGGSSICLMDEVTSGLDPISRRVIWNVILGERSRRTMVLTTHFLDECEVLSDHIVIVTLGKMKCQGTPAELKNRYGGGYRVHVPKTEDVSSVTYPVTERRDRFICRTPDSSSAAQLLATLQTSEDAEVYVTGPTIEDVFLKVSEEPHTLIGEEREDVSLSSSQPSRLKDPELKATLWSTYSRQVWALFLKRIFLLRSTWWMYFFALGIPLVTTPFLKDFLTGYVTPDCNNLISVRAFDTPMRLYNVGSLALGPASANQSIVQAVNASYGGNFRLYGDGPYIQNSRDELQSFLHSHTTNLSYAGAVWVGNDSTPLIAYPATHGNLYVTALLSVVNQVRSGVAISGYLSNLTSYFQAQAGNSFIYVTIFCLVQALYPAFFALYPTFERRSKVRALQYSNGIRPFALLLSYTLFDLVFVLIISIVCTAIIAPAAPWFGIGYIGFVQVLYGIASTLLAYLVSLMARSQPAAFSFVFLLSALMFVLSVIPLLVVETTDPTNQVTLDGLAYGLGLIFPIQNLVRAVSVGLNSYIIRCRGTEEVTYAGSIYAHGGPILLLILQIIGLFALLLWFEGASFAWIWKKPKILPGDTEKLVGSSGRPDVDAETARVMSNESDLLRVLHVSKDFGTNTAVDDVSFGLQEGEILALLGPNGAGKTTAINMIRGEMVPSSGKIFLEGVDVLKNTRLAQRHLGVCPQFDALDKLTVREHLAFYARCKGVDDIKADVSYVMSRVGISAHAKKLAGKLSGGNKRKLSLAIALIGNPPVLLLDEPSSAMDAASKRVLWKTLEAVAPGRSVLLTTHSMEEADALATRAAIVDKRVLAIGSTEALRKTHCNEYHVHLVLKSAPLSTEDEMAHVAHWARETFPAAKFEGENLGGQVRFTVPADSRAPLPSSSGTRQQQSTTSGTQGFTQYLLSTLEARKEALGLDCYSISAATMESVFLRVVKENDASEDEGVEKKRWWQW